MVATAQLLPNGEQQFFDDNGAPVALGTVDFYIPSTTTRKNTWQDSGQVSLNTNPVLLDAAGRAVIYGNGTYRQVLKKADGTQIWDKESAVPNVPLSFGVDTGTANHYLVPAVPALASYAAGQLFAFTAANGSSGASDINVNGLGVVQLYKMSAGGKRDLGTLDIITGQICLCITDAAGLVCLINPGEIKVPTVQTFTAGGTWTKPTGLRYVKVTVTGAGGGGGGGIRTGNAKGGGGGAGGTAIRVLAAASLGATETVTIGAGGGGGSGGAGGDGGPGTTSSFGAWASATGGSYGRGSTNNGTGGPGGAGASGDCNLAGGEGGTGAGALTTTGGNGPGGHGGTSFWGGGGAGGNVPGATGDAGQAFGSGGGGGSAAAAADFNGGDGKAGYCLVEEFY